MKKFFVALIIVLAVCKASPFHIMTCVEKDYESNEVTFEYKGDLYSAYYSDWTYVDSGNNVLVLTGVDDNGTTIEWFEDTEVVSLLGVYIFTGACVALCFI